MFFCVFFFFKLENYRTICFIINCLFVCLLIIVRGDSRFKERARGGWRGMGGGGGEGGPDVDIRL